MSDSRHDTPETQLATRSPEPAPVLAALGVTPAALASVLSALERTPHDLATAARAAGCRPADALAWYLLGQLPDCPAPELAAFAAEIAQRRAALAAENYARLVAAADAGDLRAIERLDALAAASQLAAYPGRAAAEQIRAACLGSAIDDTARVLAEHDALPLAEGDST